MPKSTVTNIDLGTDGASPPSIPGTGVRGWLRSIYDVVFGRIPPIVGTWGYAAGVAGTVTLTGSKRVISITAIAGASAASFTINGGDTITVPANSSLAIAPVGNLVDPTIVFTSTAGHFVEHVS